LGTGLWQPAVGTTVWTYSWNTRDSPNGPVLVTVRAYDGEDWSVYVTYDFQVDNRDAVDGGGTDWTLWALIAVVLVVMVVALWFLLSRRE